MALLSIQVVRGHFVIRLPPLAQPFGLQEGVGGIRHPRLQVLTVEELLGGKTIDMPAVAQQRPTFKKAPKAKGEGPQQLALEE